MFGNIIDTDIEQEIAQEVTSYEIGSAKKPQNVGCYRVKIVRDGI